MRHRKTNLKGMICALLSGAMILASVAPASAATARATTMKLEKTEGTVTLKTQNGSARKISNGMRLYNGNTLSTAKYSYAYVNLDDTKAVKLDQSSSATLRQSGNQLELLVKNGKLFFNVSKKLDSKESMNVRTSTMVTGVRGTCGVVEYVDQNKSKLYLIEGQVTLGTGQNATVVQGGQTATVILEDKPASTDPGKPGETPVDPEKPGETDKEVKQKVVVEKLTEKTIPPVALQEIVANPVLQEKIEKTTELKIEKIEEALEQFEKEEAERIEQEKADQEKDKDKDKEEEKKPEEQKPATDSSSSSSSGGGGGSYTPPTQSEPEVKEFTLEGTVTPGAIMAAFSDNDWVHVGFETSKTATLSLQEGETLEIPAGKTLILWGEQKISDSAEIKVGNGANLCVPEGASFVGYNTNVNMISGSMLEIHGVLRVNNLSSAGSARIKNTDQIILGGAYTSNGNDTYDATDRAVMISKGKSVGLPNHDASLLMIAQNDKRDEYYYYAECFNQNVVKDLEIATNSVSGIVQWVFNKDAVIPAGTGVEASNFNAQMNGNALVVKGTLQLKNNVIITGTGAAVIRLSGGKLNIEGENVADANNGIPYTIENTGSGYAIAYSEGTGGSIYFSNTNVRLKTAGQSEVIQGVTGEGREIRLPDYCMITEGYAPWRDENSNVIGFEPVSGEYDGTGLSKLNRALQYNLTVTVPASKVVDISASDVVTIPKGKTLELNGSVTGSGIIRVEGTGAALHVGTGSTVKIGTLELLGGSLENSGDVEVDTLLLDGTGTITNWKYIKLKSCTAKAGSTNTQYTYVDANGESILVADGYGFSDGLINGISKLACVMASEDNPIEDNPTAEEHLFKPLVSVYASRLNQLAATQMQGNRTIYGEKVVQVNVSKNVDIMDDITWDLAGAGVGLAAFEVNVATGKALTLKNINSFGGTGKAVIRLQDNATLTVTAGGISGRTPVISLKETDEYVIAVPGSATIHLNDLGLKIRVGSTADHIIQGMEVTADGGVKVPNNVQSNYDLTTGSENDTDFNWLLVGGSATIGRSE